MSTQAQTYNVSSALPTYARYWLGTVIAPSKTFAQIGQEHSNQPDFFAALLYAFLYLITELVLVIRELPLPSPPILPILAQESSHCPHCHCGNNRLLPHLHSLRQVNRNTRQKRKDCSLDQASNAPDDPFIVGVFILQ